MKRSLFFCILLIGLVAHATAYASGSYVPRPPRHLAKADREGKAIDPELYGLGRAVVLRTGDVTLSTEVNSMTVEVQRVRLEAVGRALPETARNKADLPALAGRLTDRQLEAVAYYLSIRFPTT